MQQVGCWAQQSGGQASLGLQLRWQVPHQRRLKVAAVVRVGVGAALEGGRRPRCCHQARSR